MLFVYPAAAYAENWLHESMCAMVRAIHDAYQNGVAVPAWPNIIPQQHRATLEGHHGLRDRLAKYRRAAQSLTPRQRQIVLDCLEQQNRIEELVSCVSDCKTIGQLPSAIRAPVSDLFAFGFGLLTSLKIRDRQYSTIYAALRHKICPFCGLEEFDAPGAIREDLDHYLYRGRFPLAGVNLRNLSPMGRKCNGTKHHKNILRDARGKRRRSFYPYGNKIVSISLLNSVPFGAANATLPEWKIEFTPETEESATWDVVFKIRERLCRDVLNPNFGLWLDEFAIWFVTRKGTGNLTDQRISDAIKEHAENKAIEGYTARGFLRARVFEMLYSHCLQGNQRLLQFLRTLIENAPPHPPLQGKRQRVCLLTELRQSSARGSEM